jgi:hypothetical protein
LTRVSRDRFEELVAAELAARPLVPAPLLTDEDLATLPPPVHRYVRASGAVGRPRPQNIRVEFDAAMRRKPGGSALPATSVQVNRGW